MADSEVPVSDSAAAEVIPDAPSRWPAPLRAFRHRDFRRFWFGLLISVAGSWMQNVTQGWLVWTLTDQPIYLGIIGACNGIPMLVLGLPAGVLADRMSKHRIVFITQMLSMGQAFVLAVLVYTGTIQVWHVLVLAMTLGAINAFDMPTRQAMVNELVGREDLFNAISLNSSAFNFGRIIGPAVAGVLVAEVGMAWCFFINGLSFLPLIIALTTIHPQFASPRANGAFTRQAGDAIQWAKKHEIAWALLLLTAVSSIFAMPYVIMLPMFADVVLKVGPERYGLLMSASGAGALTAALFITARSYHIRLGAAITVGTFIVPCALLLLSAAPSFPVALACLYLTGIGMMSFNMVSNTMLQKAPPDELRGRVMGLRSLVFVGLGPVGNMQIGAMAQWQGVRVAIAFGATVYLLVALVVSWLAPQVRRGHIE